MTKFELLNKITICLKDSKNSISFPRNEQIEFQYKILNTETNLKIWRISKTHLICFDSKGRRKYIPFHLIGNFILEIVYFKMKKFIDSKNTEPKSNKVFLNKSKKLHLSDLFD